MKPTILVTDSLFILPSHVERLEANGFQINRLDKPKATEGELIEAIKGCRGYILGGVEQVTAPVIAAADQLAAICFTGSGYSEFVPAHEEATRKGIAITAAKGANAVDVAEFTFGMLLEMVRHFPLLRTRNDLKGKSFFTARRLKGQIVGVIGYGRVGQEFALHCNAFGLKVLVNSRHPVQNLPSGMEYVSKETLIKKSDIISLHTNKTHGNDVLNSSDIAALKPGAIVLNAAFPEAVDCEALLKRVAAKEIRAAFDAPPHGDLSQYHQDFFSYSNAQTGFNTTEAIQDTSDRCTQSIINLLTNGSDGDVVNPEYKRYRKQ